MKNGPLLVFSGTLFGSILLSFFLFAATAGAAIPGRPVDAAELARTHPESDIRSGQQPGEESIREESSGQSESCQLSQRFPPSILQWCELITRYAEKRGLSPDLVAALIWQESGGDPQAYSRSGAVGLMQVMPSDGLAAGFVCANGPCFSSRPATSELQDPEFNIAYGTRMLAGLLKRNGSLREALKSYGPMDVGYTYADKVLSIFHRHEGRE